MKARGLIIDAGIVAMAVVLAVVTAPAGDGESRNESRKWVTLVDRALDDVFEESAHQDRTDVKEAIVQSCLQALKEGETGAKGDERAPLLRTRIHLRYELVAGEALKPEGLLDELVRDVRALCELTGKVEDQIDGALKIAEARFVSGRVAEALDGLRAEIRAGPKQVAENLTLKLAELLLLVGSPEQAAALVEPLLRSDDGRWVERAKSLHYGLTRLVPGKYMPTVDMRTLDGANVPLVAGTGRRTLVVVVTPGCGPCAGVPSDIARWRERYSSETLAMRLIVAGGRLDKSEEYARELRAMGRGVSIAATTVGVSASESSELSRALCIRSYPAGFLVSGIGKIECSSWGMRGWDKFRDAVSLRLEEPK